MKTPTLKRALLALTLLLSTASVWAADYVITYTSNGTTHYLAYENGGLTDKTTFDPATCIWEGSNNSKFKCKGASGNCYLRYNSGLTNSNQNNGSNWTIDGNYIYYTNNSQRYYINYGNSWNATQASRSSGWLGGYTYTPPTNSTILYQITTSNVGESVNMSEIDGSTSISTGTANYTCTANYYTAGTLYQWDGGSYSNATATPLAVTWNATGLPASGVTFSNGTLTVTTQPTERTIITLTATATHNNQTYTKTYTVTIRGTNEPPETGVTGGVVTLMDFEDHNWTYYQTVENGGVAGLNSPDPRNVKITYRAGSMGTGDNKSQACVSISESDSIFVYYKTIEKVDEKYSYELIPNPFSKRPSTGSGNNKQYYGCRKWRLTSVTDGTVYSGNTALTANATTGSLVDAESQIRFVPSSTYTTNCTSMEVEFTAYWEQAGVVTISGNTTEVSTTNLNKGHYELNFVVINKTANLAATNLQLSVPATVMMVTPDGSNDYRSNSNNAITGDFTAAANTKFEYININANSNTYNANAKDLIIGRGVSNTTATNNTVQDIRGLSASSTNNVNYHIRIESGRYNSISYTNGVNGLSFSISCTSNNNFVRGTLGCDYDRANSDNSKLEVTGKMILGCGVKFCNDASYAHEIFKVTMKSGKLSTRVNNAEAANSFYCGFYSTSPRQYGLRSMYIEGGELANIAGGVGDSQSEDIAFNLRMTGGTVNGSIYGAAEYAEAAGTRKYVITGGNIKGWIAGGCNGTSAPSSTTSSYGVMDGNSYGKF